MSVELRPPKVEDAPALAACFREFGRAYGADIESQGDLESWLANPGLDIDRDARVVLVEGDVVGYGDVSDAAQDGLAIYFDMRVRAEHSGEAEAALLEFLEDRAAELAKPGATLKIWSPERAENLRSLIAEHGFEFANYSVRMEVSLEGELPAPEWPEGIAVRSFDRDSDAGLVYEVSQEALEDEPDHVRDPFDEWKHYAFRDPFDPTLWFLAFDGGELTGISLCRPRRGDDSELGWIQVLGVRRPWRRRGLGRALLRHSLREFRARGKRRAGLGVHADNLAAVKLYERAGMKRERTSVWYRKKT
jgi:mycothiol synthase